MSHEIVSAVLEAQTDMEKADNLIRKYIPFIKSEASKTAKKSITESDDEFSIGMIAFHEAVRAYEPQKGNFISFASLMIRNRIIDYYRKESKHFGIDSIDRPDEDEILLSEKIKDEKDHYQTLENKQAAKKEIQELKDVLAQYGVSFTDIAENSPKQERTLEICRRVVQFAINNPLILEEIATTGRVPISMLAKKSHVSKKSLSRHRKYILAIMIIQTNGFEMIRQHLSEVLSLGKELAI